MPISAQLKYNIDAVNEYIVKRIPIPVRDFTSSPKLIVIRSFDVNKPGAEVDELKGGVAGGSILTGTLRLGQEIEIRPGIVMKDAQGKHKCQSIFSKIVSLHAEGNQLQFAVPGGLIGVGTRIDPTLCRADRLVGQVLGAVGQLPEVYSGSHVVFFNASEYSFYAPSRRDRNQPVLTPSTTRRQDGGQKANKGVEAGERRSVAHQYRLNINRWTSARHEGRPCQNPARNARMHDGRRKGSIVASHRHTLATSRWVPVIFDACRNTKLELIFDH